MDWIKSQFLTIILAALPLAGLAFVVMQQMKKNFDGVDSASSWQKRAMVTGVAFFLSVVFALVGIAFPCDAQAAAGEVAKCLVGLDPSLIEKVIRALLMTGIGSLGAMGLHAGKDSTAK